MLWMFYKNVVYMDIKTGLFGQKPILLNNQYAVIIQNYMG